MGDVIPQQVPISSPEEIDELASELAEYYADYLNISVDDEKRTYEDAIEECLTHLEEVCSSLDSYKVNSNNIGQFVAEIANKNEQLDRLYEQVDALEQYIFEANKLLDQLEAALGELESHRNIGGNKLKQIIGMLPRLSTMPRMGLFNNFQGLFDASSPSFVEGEEGADRERSQMVPVGEILDKISHIETSLESVTSSLHIRLHGKTKPVEQPKPQLNNSIATLNSESPEQVDGSWQELL